MSSFRFSGGNYFNNMFGGDVEYHYLCNPLRIDTKGVVLETDDEVKLLNDFQKFF